MRRRSTQFISPQIEVQLNFKGDIRVKIANLRLHFLLAIWVISPESKVHVRQAQRIAPAWALLLPQDFFLPNCTGGKYAAIGFVNRIIHPHITDPSSILLTDHKLNKSTHSLATLHRRHRPQSHNF